jgi:RNA polymerase-binding transcription factor
MNKQDLEYFKKKLLDQKAELEGELAPITKKDSRLPGGLDPTSGGMEVDTADDNEVADKFEEIQDNAGIVRNLETELNEVKAALERMEAGTFGISEDTGKPIERERLEANPSARTSLKHTS